MTSNRVRAVVALTVLVAATSSSGVAQPRIDAAPRIETECRLKYSRNKNLEAARIYGSKLCNFMSLPSAGSGLSHDEKVLHDCVLEVMPGPKTHNAVQLANACRVAGMGPVRGMLRPGHQPVFGDEDAVGRSVPARSKT